MNAIIKIENLTHTYSPGTPFVHTALEGVDLEIGQGELFGIIGHTGSGKSTLIQHLNGLLKPTGGRILLAGEDIWRSKESLRETRFRVGLVFQYPEYQLFEETVFRDIAFGPRNMGLDEQEIRSRVLGAMEFVGLSEELLEKTPFELSGGQKRRVAIAGVIAMRPEVLILDEPTAGLDPRGRREILEHIRTYHEQSGSTVVIVTHSMEDIARYADRIAVMARGRIVMNDAPPAIFSRAAELAEIGLAVPQITEVFIRLAQLGLPVGTDVYTVKYGLRQLLSLKGGCGDA